MGASEVTHEGAPVIDVQIRYAGPPPPNAEAMSIRRALPPESLLAYAWSSRLARCRPRPAMTLRCQFPPYRWFRQTVSACLSAQMPRRLCSRRLAGWPWEMSTPAATCAALKTPQPPLLPLVTSTRLGPRRDNPRSNASHVSAVLLQPNT
jgi:hypothetical protein